jgi:predicted GNAT family N-acyltransferase
MSDQAMRLSLQTWATAQAAASAVRLAVFVSEQGIPEAEEWDATDAVALHAVCLAQGQALATGRVWRDAARPDTAHIAHIGRLAVLASQRGRGIGRMVLQALMQQAREWQCSSVVLHAQTSALGFYEAQGFVAEGECFDEVGIAHVRMRCAL